MRVDREDCQRIAAVRIGSGEEQQFALVIMPPGGGLVRVEPVEQSSNPLAPITESYASLMDMFRAAPAEDLQEACHTEGYRSAGRFSGKEGSCG